MRLDFKKLFSFVLALVMMVSTLTVVNVAAADNKNYLVEGNEFNPTSDKIDYKSGDTVSGIFNFTINENVKTTVNYESGTYTRSVKISGGKTTAGITFITSADNAMLTVGAANTSNSGTRGCSLDTTGDANLSEKFGSTGNTHEFKIATKGSHTFRFLSNANLYYLKLEDAGIGQSLTWRVDQTGAASLKGTLSADGVEGKDYAILKYSPADDSDNYELLSTKRVITTATQGVKSDTAENSYVFTIADAGSADAAEVGDYFMENAKVPLANIKVEGGGNRVLHLECPDHNSVVSVKLNAEGVAEGTLISNTSNGGYEVDTTSPTLPLHEDTYTISMGGGTLKEKNGDTEVKEFKVESSASALDIKFAADPFTFGTFPLCRSNAELSASFHNSVHNSQ